jgi:NAD+ synthetase
MAVDARGEISVRAPDFEESVLVAELTGDRVAGDIASEREDWEAEVVDALCLGLADYVRKCGFPRVLVGLSGGIDSALTCALAVRALGSDRVIGISMPSQHSSDGSRDDARALAETHGIRCDTVPIAPIYDAFTAALAPGFEDRPADVTEENLQARIRGTLLMAYSNKLGGLVLATGNRSEVAAGYATLYGDMCGGLAVIADLYKTEVWALARFLNRGDPPPIPQTSIDKPPSAELAPGQTDQDSLPPYEVLDAVLRARLDQRLGRDELIAAGHPAELVDRVLTMVQRSEHKRRQAAPALQIRRTEFPATPVARAPR